MFKNRSIQMKIVKDASESEPPTNAFTRSFSHWNPERIDAYNAIVKDHAKNATLAVGGVLVAKKLLDTVCEIAIIAAKAKLR